MEEVKDTYYTKYIEVVGILLLLLPLLFQQFFKGFVRKTCFVDKFLWNKKFVPLALQLTRFSVRQKRSTQIKSLGVKELTTLYTLLTS